MAKNRMDEEPKDKKKAREQRRANREAEKSVIKSDAEKIKAADASYKEAKKAKRQANRQERRNGADAGPITFNGDSGQKRVTHIVADPQTGTQTSTNYKSLGDYVKDNPSDTAIPTISGKDPKTETVSNVIDKSNTYGEMKSGNALGQQVKETVENVNNEVDKEEFAIDVSKTEKIGEEGDGTRNTEGGYKKYPGEGGSLGDIARKGSGQYELTDEQYAKLAYEHKRANAMKKAGAPALAIEQLGIEHYYPPQQDFITSNFTGRYIGSRQLVAATGALFPEGLVDARKRALQAKAKAKAELNAAFWELSDTAPQYDERYKDIGMDMLQKFYNLADRDVESLLSGKTDLSMQMFREMHDYKSRGKNLEEMDAYVKELVEKMNSGDEYIPPEILKNMIDFRTGTADLDEYLQGKGIGDEKVRRMANTFRSYQNFTPLANDQLKLLNDFGADKLPLNKDANLNDPTFATRMSEAISQVKNKGVGYDEYVKVMGEFYDIEAVETIVENIYRTNNLYEGTTDKEYEEQIQNGVKYFMAVLPDKIDIDQKLQANQSLGWAQHYQDVKEFDWEKQKYEDKKISMWDGVNIDLSEAQMRAEAIDAFSKSKDPKRRAEAWQRALAAQKKEAVNLGGLTVAAIPTQGTTISYSQPNRLKVISLDGNVKSLDAAIRDYDTKLASDPNNPTLKAGKQELVMMKSQQGNVQHQVSGRFAGYSVYDDTRQGYVPAEYYDGDINSDDLVNTAYLTGKVGIIDYDSNGRPVTQDGEIKTRPSALTYVNTYNIEGEEVRRALTREEGTEEQTSRYYSDGKGGTVTETSSGSGSSR